MLTKFLRLVDSALSGFGAEPRYFARKRVEERLRALIREAQELNISEYQVDQMWREVLRERADEAFERLKKFSFLTDSDNP